MGGSRDLCRDCLNLGQMNVGLVSRGRPLCPGLPAGRPPNATRQHGWFRKEFP